MPREKSIVHIPVIESITSTSNMPVFQQQINLLIEAINCYLNWRQHKNEPDNRNYATTLFTWLRHYTQFGENRALMLKQTLSEKSKHSPIYFLKRHFKQDSRVNNHSLDTYLLEKILENRYLFLIPNVFNDLTTIDSRIVLRSFILEQAINTEPECAYLVGCYFEAETTLANNLDKACTYYVLALKNEHELAREKLIPIAQAGNIDVQYQLGIHYHQQNNIDQAIKWCLQAASQKHPKAMTYFPQQTFDAKNNLLIAQHFETQQDGVNALDFYQKASALNNKEAAFRLGQLFDPYNRDKSSLNNLPAAKKDSKKAFDYYVVAAAQQDKAALTAAVSIESTLQNPDTTFILGKIYLENFTNPKAAFDYFNLLPKDYAQQVYKLIFTASNCNAEHAYQFGCVFQSNKLFKKACLFYLAAIKQKNQQALEALISLAKTGNSEAQYTLGAQYYHNNGDINQAIDYCIFAAEQGHQEAKNYLSTTQFSKDKFFSIANAYDKGIGVAKNLNLALAFYEKSCALENSDSAYRLGQLYDPANNSKKTLNLPNTQKDLIKSFDYYCIGLKQKNEKALPAIMTIIQRARTKSSTKFKDFVKKAVNILNALTKKDGKLAYMMADYYEKNSQLKQAYSHYSNALIASQPEAIKAVQRLAKTGDKEAQYTLAIDYYHRQNLLNKAIYWCMQAAAQQHTKAVNYLLETKFSAAQYFELAQCYDQGLGVAINTTYAINFYRKAYELNHPNAAYQLGRLYDINQTHHLSLDQANSLNELKNEQQACDYYLVAANQQNIEALAALTKIAEQTDDAKLLLQLAQELIRHTDTAPLALSWLKKLADSTDKNTLIYLKGLITNNSDYAYKLAKLYEDDTTPSHHCQLACFYYAIAIQQDKNTNQQKSFQQHLDVLRNSDSVTATELTELGLLYFHGQKGIIKNLTQALQCFKIAHDQGAEKACYYLGLIYEQQQNVDNHWLLALSYFQQANDEEPGLEKNKLTILLATNRLTLPQLNHLALCYQQGKDGLTKDTDSAIRVYQKLMQLNDASAAFSLGQLYQIEHNGVVNATTLAFEAYLKAAQLGNLAALKPLEQLGEQVSAAHQQQLSQSYCSNKFFINKTKGTYWAEQAQGAKGFDFKR